VHVVASAWPCATRALAQESTEEPVEVVVQGAPPHPHSPPRDEAVAGSVVPRERLEAPGLTPADVLRREAGVEIVQYGGFGAPATASIRGATAAQTPVYLAGIRLNDEVGGSADLSQVPLWLVDHVEIYRGNAPLYADQFGIGGAILFEPVRPRGTSAGAGLTAGSFGTASGFAWAAVGDQKDHTLIGAELAHADNDYAFPDDRGTLFVPGDDTTGRQTNADATLLDAWTLSRFELGRGTRLEVVASGAAREQGVPRLALVPSEHARARYDRVLVSARARGRFGLDQRHAYELASSYVRSRSRFEDPDRELGFASARVETVGRRAAQRAALDLWLHSRLALTTTLDLSIDQLRREDEGVEELQSGAPGGRLAGGLSWEPVDGWFLVPKAGVACQGGGEASACGRAEPVGRLALMQRSEAVTLFASLGRYARFPTLGELYGAGVLVRGNPDLLPERGLTADVGARAQAALGRLRLWGDLALYGRRADRLVSYVRAAQGFLVPVNVQAARVLGAEMSGGADLGEHLGGDLSLTLTDPRDVTDARPLTNDILPFHSRLVLAAGVGVASKAHLPGSIERSRARLSLLHQSSRFADPAGLVVIPAQSTLDLELTQGFAREHVLARARIANLLDEQRFDVVGYPLPGRSVFVSIEVVSR